MKILKTAKKLLVLLLAAVMALSLGCTFEGRKTNKKLPALYTSSPVVSARFYTSEGGSGRVFYELDENLLEAFVNTLNGMELKTHSFHTDYFWAGRYGVELSYEDGTFMTYDGTCAVHRSASMSEDDSYDAKLMRGFIEVSNCDFWEEMLPFFPQVGEGSYSSLH